MFSKYNPDQAIWWYQPICVVFLIPWEGQPNLSNPWIPRQRPSTSGLGIDFAKGCGVCLYAKVPIIRRWNTKWFQFFQFSPDPWGNDLLWAYFVRWLVQPTTRIGDRREISTVPGGKHQLRLEDKEGEKLTFVFKRILQYIVRIYAIIFVRIYILSLHRFNQTYYTIPTKETDGW